MAAVVEEEIKDNSYIKIITVGNTPIDLYIVWDIERSDPFSKIRVTINAELNIMMKMMATKPLQNLADYMAGRIGDAMNL